MQPAPLEETAKEGVQLQPSRKKKSTNCVSDTTWCSVEFASWEVQRDYQWLFFDEQESTSRSLHLINAYVLLQILACKYWSRLKMNPFLVTHKIWLHICYTELRKRGKGPHAKQPSWIQTDKHYIKWSLGPLANVKFNTCGVQVLLSSGMVIPPMTWDVQQNQRMYNTDRKW